MAMYQCETGHLISKTHHQYSPFLQMKHIQNDITFSTATEPVDPGFHASGDTCIYWFFFSFFDNFSKQAIL